MLNVIAPENLKILRIHGPSGCFKMNKSDVFTVLLTKSNITQKIKCDGKGIVEFKCSEGDIKQKNDLLCVLSPCTHAIVIKEMCGICSTQVEIKNFGNGEMKCSSGNRLAILHNNKNVMVKKETAIEISLIDYVNLLKKRKLSLLVDLDSTILHSTDKLISNCSSEVCHYTMRAEQNSNILLNYHTKFRPFLKEFLTEMSSFYEMHIYTFGNKSYAEKIAELIDVDKRFFGRRIISKDDSFDPMKKSANLKSLFPRGDNMVVIIDDRTDVWNHAPNCIHVQPYFYFPEIGDINDPHKGRDFIDTSVNKSIFRNFSDDRSVDNKKQKLQDKSSENVPEKSIPEEKTGIINQSIVDIEDLEKGEKINNEAVSLSEDRDDKIDGDGTVNANKSGTGDEPSVTVPEKIDEINEIVDGSQSEKIDSTDGHNERDMDEVSEKINNDPVAMETAPTNEIEDRDRYLLSLASILKEIHNRYYDEIDKLQSDLDESLVDLVRNNRLPDIKNIMGEMRSHILRGCRVNFSGIVPLNQKVKDSYEHRMVLNLGGEYLQNVSLPSLRSKSNSSLKSEYTTHLLCKNEGTKKMKQVAHYINEINRCTIEKSEKLPRSIHKVHLVKPDWLWQSYFFWQKVNEDDFLLLQNLKQMPIPEGFSEWSFEGPSNDNLDMSTDGSNIRKRRLSDCDDLIPSPKVPCLRKKEEETCRILDALKELEGIDEESLSGVSTDTCEDSVDSYNDKDVPLNNIILHYSIQEQMDMINEVDEAMDEEKYEKLKSPESSDYYNSGSSTSSENSDKESEDFMKPPKNWEKDAKSDKSNSSDDDHQILDYGDCEETRNAFGFSKENIKSDFDDFFDDF